jgi:hypothetical protein
MERMRSRWLGALKVDHFSVLMLMETEGSGADVPDAAAAQPDTSPTNVNADETIAEIVSEFNATRTQSCSQAVACYPVWNEPPYGYESPCGIPEGTYNPSGLGDFSCWQMAYRMDAGALEFLECKLESEKALLSCLQTCPTNWRLL